MRTLTKSLVAVTASAALIATGTACSSSGGGASKSPIADIKTLTGKSTSVKLDSGFVAALGTLKLAPAPTGTATFDSSTGTITFPITGGHATVYNKGAVTPYVQGSIEHNGSGLSLTGGSTVVTLQNFVIDPGSNSSLSGEVLANGKVAVQSAKLFDLDGSTLQPITVDKSTGVATLTGTRVLISSDAAALLNKTFNTTAVKAGTLVGIATLLVNTK